MRCEIILPVLQWPLPNISKDLKDKKIEGVMAGWKDEGSETQGDVETAEREDSDEERREMEDWSDEEATRW